MALNTQDRWKLMHLKFALQRYGLPWQDFTVEQALEYAIHYEGRAKLFPEQVHVICHIQNLYTDYAELLEKAEN